MTYQSNFDRNRSLAERKRRLLLEGAAFRAEMIRYRDVVRSNMNGESLTKNLLGRVAGKAFSMVAKHPGLFNASRLQSLAPLLVTGVSLLSKRSLRKSLVLGSILIAAVGAATYFSGRNNKAVDEEE
jgi:drug/metabolite transporter (DMT)-like permease